MHASGHSLRLIRLLRVAVSIALGVVLLWAGAVKVYDPRSFLATLDLYNLFPLALAKFLAMMVPWVEVVVGLVLLSTIRHRGAAILATVLGVAFVLAQSWALYHGLKIPCGCFGSTAQNVDGKSLFRAAAVAIAGAWLVLALHISPAARHLPGPSANHTPF
jgi:uncharacterized membrane protein YphA (DoxX/SURF4 family)